jgi:hypothetical protein
VRFVSFQLNAWTVLAALFAGAAAMLSVEWAWVASRGPVTTKTDIHIESTIDGSHKIAVEDKAPPSKNCLMITQNLLYRDRDEKEAPGRPRRVYVPLAGSINGLGFGGVEDYEIQLKVPVGIDRTRWNFTTRSAYVCNSFPGFSTSDQLATVPLPIDLSEKDGSVRERAASEHQ